MKAANLLRAIALGILLAAPARVAQAQTEVGAQLDLFSDYVWRGVTLTNKPVAQPDLWLTLPAGQASVTVGGWANVELGRYDNVDDDISESGGLSSLDLSEFNPYGEVSFTAGKATLTGGITGYLYPNDLTDESNGGLDSESNTWEVYGKVGFEVPLAPAVAVYYDIDKIKGAYIEGAVSHSLPLGEKATLDLGALAGFSAGQDAELDDLGFPTVDFFNFAENGLTHVDLSAGIPLTAGAFSITPVVHFQINSDEATKFTSPSDVDKDTKVWFGVSLGWARTLGEQPAEEE